MGIFCRSAAILTLLGVLAWPAAAQRAAPGSGPEVGQPAPELKLKTLEGKEVHLASIKDKMPVVLIFGSCT